MSLRILGLAKVIADPTKLAALRDELKSAELAMQAAQAAFDVSAADARARIDAANLREKTLAEREAKMKADLDEAAADGEAEARRRASALDARKRAIAQREADAAAIFEDAKDMAAKVCVPLPRLLVGSPGPGGGIGGTSTYDIGGVAGGFHGRTIGGAACASCTS